MTFMWDTVMKHRLHKSDIKHLTLLGQEIPLHIAASWGEDIMEYVMYYCKTRRDTDLERGYGDVRPWRSPFHASPAVSKGPISSKRVSSQDPLLRKFWNLSFYSLNFHSNFSSQAPKFGNFQFTSPRFQRQISVYKPHTSEIRVAHPYMIKSRVPHPPLPRLQAGADVHSRDDVGRHVKYQNDLLTFYGRL